MNLDLLQPGVPGGGDYSHGHPVGGVLHAGRGESVRYMQSRGGVEPSGVATLVGDGTTSGLTDYTDTQYGHQQQQQHQQQQHQQQQQQHQQYQDPSYDEFLQWRRQQHAGQQQQQWAGLAGDVTPSAQSTQHSQQSLQQHLQQQQGQHKSQQHQQQQVYTSGQPLSAAPPRGFSSLPSAGGLGLNLGAGHTLQTGLSTAGLGFSNIGLQTGDVDGLFKNVATGKSVVEGDILASLHAANEASKRKRSKLWIRPDYHLPIDKEYHEMSYRELIYGMINVTQALIIADHPDLNPLAYLDHMKFIALKEIKPTYDMKAICQYDRDVTDKVLKKQVPGFAAADHGAMSNHMGLDKTLAYIKMQQEMSKHMAALSKTPNKIQSKSPGQGKFRIDCPDHLCKRFNFTTCDWQMCKKLHSCAVCGGAHGARGCARNPYNQAQGQGGYNQGQHQQQTTYYGQQNSQNYGQHPGGQRNA